MQNQRDATGLQFGEGMAALENLVARLESGDLPLEEALGLFEEGVGLIRVLNDKLNEAERRIEILSRGEDGAARIRLLGEEEQ